MNDPIVVITDTVMIHKESHSLIVMVQNSRMTLLKQSHKFPEPSLLRQLQARFCLQKFQRDFN